MTTSKVKNYNKGYEITQPIKTELEQIKAELEPNDDDWFSTQIFGTYTIPEPLEFTLMFPWGPVEIMAGPYRDKPADVHGIKLAAEFSDECAVSLPIKDFSVPENDSDVDAALMVTMHLLRMGKPIYAGCMGGKGRTGLFLALLAKVALQAEKKWWQFSLPDPVELIREIYRPEAVETKKQEAYVRSYDVRNLARVIKHWRI